MNEYQQQAVDFLTRTGTTLEMVHQRTGPYSPATRMIVTYIDSRSRTRAANIQASSATRSIARSTGSHPASMMCSRVCTAGIRVRLRNSIVSMEILSGR